MYYVLCIMYYVLYIIYYILYIICYVLYIMCYMLYIIYYILPGTVLVNDMLGLATTVLIKYWCTYCTVLYNPCGNFSDTSS